MVTATEHRRELERLDRYAQAAVAGAFAQAPLHDPAEAAGMLRQAIPEVVIPLGEVATTNAAAFYTALRTEAPVSRRFVARTIAGPPAAQIDGMVRWAVTPLFFDDPRQGEALARMTGGTQRLIRQADRETIVEATEQDPDSYGWRRVTGPDACKFCVGLADRGGVYRRSTVDFAAHDNCQCSAAPNWDPGVREVQARAYTASQRTTAMSETQRRRHRAETRAWLNRDYPHLPG